MASAGIGRRWLTMLALAAALALTAASARAAPLPSDAFGINLRGSPPNLIVASSAGVGLARLEVIDGTNADAVVELTASAHLRLSPELGLPQSHGANADAAEMSTFVTALAQRYGTNGSFWAEHPELPYLPVESYEIGNEPDITPTQPADSISLHYASPADYALVYAQSRTALHAVVPGATVVVGGMLDSGAIPLAEAERYLAALGPVDAVGYHPYLYDESLMKQDTVSLRTWLDLHGDAAVPLDINEFGVFTGLTSDASWGATVADYSQWALCTPALEVENVQPFWWGGIAAADSSPWRPLTDSALGPTPYGAAYLAEATALTSRGCPPVVTAPPSASPTPNPGTRGGATNRRARLMLGTHVRLDRRGRLLVAVRCLPGPRACTGRLSVTAGGAGKAQTLASVSIALHPGQSATIALTLSRGVAAWLRRRPQTVTVRAVLNQGATSATSSRPRVLRR